MLQQGDVDILNFATKVFAEQPNVAAIFLKNGNTPYQAGDRLVQKDLAQTLLRIVNFRPGSSIKYKHSGVSEVFQRSAI